MWQHQHRSRLRKSTMQTRRYLRSTVPWMAAGVGLGVAVYAALEPISAEYRTRHAN